MKPRAIFLGRLRQCRETAGQDLIEYALLAGFVAVAAGAVVPDIVTSMSTIFTTVGSALTTAVQAN